MEAAFPEKRQDRYETPADLRERAKQLGRLAAYATEMSGVEREELGRAFYREILLPPEPHGSTRPPIEMAIIGPALLYARGAPIKLRDHQIFLWNLLVHLRNRPEGIANADAFAFGMAAGKTEKARRLIWTRNIHYLMDRVNQAAQGEVIRATGNTRQRRYSIDTGVTLTDLRKDHEAERYLFTRTVTSGMLRHTEPYTLTVADTEPVELVIRDDDAVVINNEALFLNHHEHGLLNIITLRGTEPLAYPQLWALGFHAYGPHDRARLDTAGRTVRGLNALAGGAPLLRFTQDSPSGVQLARTLRIVDLRDAPTQPTPADIQPMFDRLLLGAPNNIERPKLIHMPPDDISQLLRAHGAHVLTLRQRYLLSLRFGLPTADLRGTAITDRRGNTYAYNQLVEQITPGEVIGRAKAARMVGMAKGNAFEMEQRALRKLVGRRRLDTLRSGNTIEKALYLAEQFPAHTRLDTYKEGRVQAALAETLGCPPAARQAVAVYLRSLGGETQLSPDTEAGLYHLRRTLRRTQKTLGDSGAITALPSIKDYYKRACAYLARMASTRKNIVSFQELARHDPHFAEAGEQYIADACTLLAAFQSLDLSVRGRGQD